MKKQQQQQWILLFKVFFSCKTTLTPPPLINSSSSPSYNIARPCCSLATTTTTNKKQQQQLHMMMLLEKKKLPLLIVPIVQKKKMFIVESQEFGSDGCFHKKESEIASTVCDDTLSFISLFHDNDDHELINNKEVLKLHLPEIADRRICGSSEGWLVSVHENGEIQLLNPFSKVLVHLPSLTTFPEVVTKFVSEEIAGGGELIPKHKRGLFYLVDEYSDDRRSLSSSSRTYHFSSFEIYGSQNFREYFLGKVVTNTTTTATTIDANSTTTTSLVVPTVVMAIYGCRGKLAFCRPSTGINGNDDEKNKWISSPELNGNNWQDVIFYKGSFYAVHLDGSVKVVKGLDGPSPSFMEIIIKRRIYFKENYFTYMNYLVESSSSSSSSSSGGGDLLLVTRYIETTKADEEEEYMTIEFEVLKLNFNRWIKVTNLGEDCALFIGHNHSFSFSANKFPGFRGNCIYFTNNLEMILDFSARGHDIGVYNLEDGSIERLDYETSSSQLFVPPPIWYVPN